MTNIILVLIGIVLHATCELLKIFYGDEAAAPGRIRYGHDFLYR